MESTTNIKETKMQFSKEFMNDLATILECYGTEGGYLEFDIDGTKLGVDISFTIY